MTRRAILSILTLLALGACTRTDAAVDPAWGKQPCAHCAMVLSDKEFGAQLVTEEGERRFFDDVGCMVVFMEKGSAKGARAWVRDGAGGTWLDARSAHYVAASSPMDFGFGARAAEGIAWDEMRARVLAKEAAR